MEWETIPRDEQETIINVDYEERTLNFYTTRKNVATKLARKIGKPEKVHTMNGKIVGIEYIKKLSYKNIRYFLSTTIVIGGFRADNTKDSISILDE